MFDAAYQRRVSLRLLDELDDTSSPDTTTPPHQDSPFRVPSEAQKLCDAIQQSRPTRPSQFSVLDLGCGPGDVTGYLAKRLDAVIFGIDFSLAALNATAPHRSNRTAFICSDFAFLPFATSTFYAAISLDALYLSTNKHRALSEASRVLYGGSRLVFTIFSSESDSEENIAAWRSALMATGFDLLGSSDHTHQWRHAMRQRHWKRLSIGDKLLEFYGPDVAAELEVSRAMLGIGDQASFIDQHRRIWFDAVKR